MQIQLCEDDGDFHGGTPQLVVLIVKFDDGKTKRIPYPAEKSIASLYQDLRAIEPNVKDEKVSVSPLQQAKMDLMVKTVEDNFVASVAPPVVNKPPLEKVDKSHIIEKEDIVTMVKMHERDKGATCLLMVGMDYRVIEVLGPRLSLPGKPGITQLVDGYDVIDDHAPTPERMRVFPDEVVLKSKRLSKIVAKVTAVEEILPCPHCQATNSLILQGTEFKGTCDECSQEITIARIIKHCQTDSCKKENVSVSCFDVGGKYEGSCGTCGSKIEVPYA